jgi:lipopolysaccharide/colanic/teichoic acid biosynthesis glycosyltransferase
MRRLVDVVVSAAALIILFPLMVAIAIGIVMDSPGDPFYRASRVGRGGRKFRMWKFRTMSEPGNPWQKGPGITSRGDVRITRFGRILRRSKLDELPQFFNVLMGQMTLVGPRPESEEFVAFYNARQRAVLRVKPGITGCVQLASAEESDSIPEGVHADQYYVEHLMGPKLEMDLVYLENRTAWTDAALIFKTAGMVVRVMTRMLVRGRAEVPEEEASELVAPAEPAMQVSGEGARDDHFDRSSL